MHFNFLSEKCRTLHQVCNCIVKVKGEIWNKNMFKTNRHLFRKLILTLENKCS